MKKIPLFTSILLIAGVLATMAFSHPLVVRNGPVTSYSAGSTITIQNHGIDETYFLRQGTTMLPGNVGGNLAAGARVTVVAQCFHYGVVDRNASTSSGEANQHPCIALAVIVRSTAAGVVPATGGTGTTATGTATPGSRTTTPSAGTETPAVIGTETPVGGTSLPGTGGAAIGTPTASACICPTATGTAAPATGATMTPTPTLAAGTGTGTATATPFCTCTPAATSTP